MRLIVAVVVMARKELRVNRRREVQGPAKGCRFGVMPRPFRTTSTPPPPWHHTMDDDLLHDVFATDNLWKPSDFTRDALSYESSLFAPLQFDGTFKRVKHALHCIDHIQSP
jgi:hypothetical protein